MKDPDCHSHVDDLHDRITGIIKDFGPRLTALETTVPHLNAVMAQLEKRIERLNSHITRAIWAVLLLFIAAVFKFAIEGGFMRLTGG